MARRANPKGRVGKPALWGAALSPALNMNPLDLIKRYLVLQAVV